LIEFIHLTKKSSITHFRNIARIHKKELSQGALHLLGLPFLTRLYFEISGIPETSLWAAVYSGRTIGFISGTLNIKKSYRILIFRSGLALLFLSLKEIIKPGVLKKIKDIMIYPFFKSKKDKNINMCSNTQSTTPELLSIAIDRKFHGQGIGRKLVENLENDLLAMDFRGKYYVSTDKADIVSNNFYMKLGFKKCGVEKVHDLYFQKYYKEI